MTRGKSRGWRTVSQRVRFLTFQVHYLFHPRKVVVPVGGAEGFDPDLLGQGGGSSEVLDEGARDARIAVVFPPQFPDIDSGGRQGIADQVGALDRGKKLSDAWVGCAVVVESGEQGGLVGPVFRAAAGEVRFFVPAEQVGTGSQERRLADALDEFLVCLLRSHRFGPADPALPRTPSDSL
jgi:hypothetical protein